MKLKNVFKRKTAVLLVSVFCVALISIPFIFAADQYEYDNLGRVKKVTHDRAGHRLNIAMIRPAIEQQPERKLFHQIMYPIFPASNPDPYNGATGVLTLPVLEWAGGDSDGASDLITYSIYLGTNSNPTTLIGTVAQPGNVSPISYALTQTLSTSTTYYWKVVPKDSKGATPDPEDIYIWNFTTTGC